MKTLMKVAEGKMTFMDYASNEDPKTIPFQYGETPSSGRKWGGLGGAALGGGIGALAAHSDGKDLGGAALSGLGGAAIGGGTGFLGGGLIDLMRGSARTMANKRQAVNSSDQLTEREKFMLRRQLSGSNTYGVNKPLDKRDLASALDDANQRQELRQRLRE